jgi:hypothetical protein
VSRAACVEEKHELELRDWDGRRLSLTGLLRTYDDDAGDVNRGGGGALRFLLLCPAGILDDIVKERSQLPVLELRVEKACTCSNLELLIGVRVALLLEDLTIS